MIVSHSNKYIFIAIHHTGSTVIEEELCEHYGGKKVRHKHSLPALLPRSVRGYKLIGGVRNPASDLCAQYQKYLTDHRGIYSDQISGNAEQRFMTKKAVRLFRGIQAGEISFEKFVDISTRVPYVARIALLRSRYTYVYRVEELEEEFPKILMHCGITPVRSLPVRNRTTYAGERADLSSLLLHPGLRAAAVELNYLDAPISRVDGFAYRMAKRLKTTAWFAREFKSVMRHPGFLELESALINETPR